MKWLACFEIGFEGFFVVEIDDWKDVSQLKEMIKDIILYSFPAEHLKLYVAKKGDRWLQSNDPNMIKQNGEMDANYSMLNEAFGFPDVGDADEEDVHVLVDMPEYAKKDLLFFRYNCNARRAYDSGQWIFACIGLGLACFMLFFIDESFTDQKECLAGAAKELEIRKDNVRARIHEQQLLSDQGTLPNLRIV
ncbi:hypothetical protein Ae201684P_006530 [Aphanomyces euteiches]|nr:hypothetical protein Ae201684P_006309 [Aphanomyces euteiches]KAH9091130.1 hypothetical protein Ae201684P_006530 [Aphanomyces euteiches]